MERLRIPEMLLLSLFYVADYMKEKMSSNGGNATNLCPPIFGKLILPSRRMSPWSTGMKSGSIEPVSLSANCEGFLTVFI